MLQSPLQRRLHLHLPELADGEVQIFQDLPLVLRLLPQQRRSSSNGLSAGSKPASKRCTVMPFTPWKKRERTPASRTLGLYGIETGVMPTPTSARIAPAPRQS